MGRLLDQLREQAGEPCQISSEQAAGEEALELHSFLALSSGESSKKPGDPGLDLQKPCPLPLAAGLEGQLMNQLSSPGIIVCIQILGE